MFDALIEGEDDEPNTDNINELKISYININGLNNDKIKNTDMIKDMDNADIICFSETHLKNESDYPLIECYSGQHTTGKKSIKSGRNIKGISVYIKDELKDLKIDKVISEKGTIIINRITQKCEQLSDIYLLICYRSNKESKYKDKDFYENIKDYIIKYKMENILIIGDLNGRK